MLRTLAKPFLWLVTCAIPVFISACYGSGYDGTGGSRSRILDGTVTNASGQGVTDILVKCLDSGGYENDRTVSQEGGYYEIRSYEDSPCRTLRFEDIDGAENGTYLPQDLTVDPSADSFDIVLQEPAE